MEHAAYGDSPQPVIKTSEEIYEHIRGTYRKVVGQLSALDEKAEHLENPDSINADLVALRESLTTLFILVTLLHNSSH